MSASGFTVPVNQTKLLLNAVTTSGTPQVVTFDMSGCPTMVLDCTYSGTAGPLTFTFTTNNELVASPSAFKSCKTDLAAGTVGPLSLTWTAGTSDSCSFPVPNVARLGTISVTGPAGTLTMYGTTYIISG